ncbi:MAG: hypothetical protein K0U60_04875 [Actinomycetia bacterium]|nr:hypothetical protein [Actinomycetes bacterium]MCH9802024.1 hypothetical protein [Actinomycetes bacterium]
MSRLSSRLLAVLSALFMTGGVLLAAGPAQADKNVFFETKNGKVSCEMTKGKSLGTQVFCLVMGNKVKSATLAKNGDVEKCKGVKCAANPPEDIGVLMPKEKEKVGPFTCRAKSKKAVVCKVTKTGAGFKMNSKGKIDIVAGAQP